jgi:hypothetical protein
MTVTRDQARIRQARKRRRDREARLDLRAKTIAEQMPPAWRAEWLKSVQHGRGRAKRAAAEVDRMLAFIPSGDHSKFVARNRPHAKFSLTAQHNHFLRMKEKQRRVEADQRATEKRQRGEAEGYDPNVWPPLFSDDVGVMLGELWRKVPFLFGPGSWWWWAFACEGEGGFLWKEPAPGWGGPPMVPPLGGNAR